MIAVCLCQSPLIAGTSKTIEIDGVLVENDPPICVRCYVRDRELAAQPHRFTPVGDATGVP
jgi:hypothetical protein